jgi:methionyl-tRNA formyltransferase
MTKSKKLVFFGTDDFSLVILESLVKAGYDVMLVVTKPDAPQGRSHHLTPSIVGRYAALHELPYLTPQKLDDEALGAIREAGCDYAVLASYGKIIPTRMLDAFPLGIINVHPSLLPRWRGPSPVEAAILAGDNQTGVSIMRLEPSMDTGPVFAQTEYPLSGRETGDELRQTLAEAGARLLLESLPGILAGSTPARAQDDFNESPSYCSMIRKTDGQIDWQESADTIERKIRAYQPWPGAKTSLFEHDVTILAATVELNSQNLEPGENIHDKSSCLVGCGNGALSITRLQPAGRKPMAVRDFLNGLRRV